MTEKTKNREELKAYFVKNSIPKEYQFKDLINAMINQEDDGIVKEQDQPLSIAASGEAASEKKVLHLYQDFDQPTPDWTLSLNPATGSGLNISDGDGSSRFFIGRSTGNVGIGTHDPKAKLDIQQAVRTGTHPSIKGLYITGDIGADKDGVEFRHSNASQGIGFGYNTIYATGSNENQDLGLKARGTGQVRIESDLEVIGKLFGAVNGSNNENLRIALGRTSPSKTDWIRYSADGIYATIDTSSAGFTTTPIYFTSLGGDGSHWTTKGSTSIYDPGKIGFSIYIWQDNLTVDFARKYKWHVNWIGIGK
jgi:hypothetical protein